ncbi:hypothetical protein ACWCPD_16115 [Streptomyces sp. NPDC001935]
MTTRTPAQKLARQIQAETGRPYTACLAEAKRRLEAADDNKRRSQP